MQMRKNNTLLLIIFTAFSLHTYPVDLDVVQAAFRTSVLSGNIKDIRKLRKKYPAALKSIDYTRLLADWVHAVENRSITIKIPIYKWLRLSGANIDAIPNGRSIFNCLDGLHRLHVLFGTPHILNNTPQNSTE